MFEFVSGIEETLANKLKIMGIIVKGTVLPDSRNFEDFDDSYESSDEEEIFERYLYSYIIINKCTEAFFIINNYSYRTSNVANVMVKFGLCRSIHDSYWPLLIGGASLSPIYRRTCF